MSLKTDIMKHRSQLSPQFRQAVMRLDDNADPDKPFIASALVQYSGDKPLNVPGVGAVSGSAQGGFVTARDISPNGLKNLLEQPHVSYIDGGSKFRLP